MKPNILLITTDQQRGDCFGFEGRRIKTPHFDTLAREGSRFSTCITPSLVCMPSRSSILTGLLPLTHGVRDNGIDLPGAMAEAGFAAQLTRAGYRTHFAGKAHFSTHNTFDKRSTGRPENTVDSADFGPDWTGPHMGFETFESIINSHDLFNLLEPPRGLHYKAWFHADGRGREKLALHKALSPTKDKATVPFHSLLPPDWHTSSWIGDRTIAFLRERGSRPFCLWASFPDPHYPFDAPRPWSQLHHPDDVDLPLNRTLDLDRRPEWHRRWMETRCDSIVEIEDYDLPLITDPARQERYLREMVANYYGMISLADHNVGRILIALDDLGLAEETLVIVTADHGDFLGDHGLVLKGPCAYEGLLRVGLIARGPGVPAGRVIEEPVSTMDLAATVLDYAGVAPDRPMHARSLRRLMEGAEESRDFAYQEWNVVPWDGTPELQLRTVRCKRHKLSLELASGEGELYDLEEDPHEMDNLFGDP